MEITNWLFHVSKNKAKDCLHLPVIFILTIIHLISAILYHEGVHRPAELSYWQFFIESREND